MENHHSLKWDRGSLTLNFKWPFSIADCYYLSEGTMKCPCCWLFPINWMRIMIPLPTILLYIPATRTACICCLYTAITPVETLIFSMCLPESVEYMNPHAHMKEHPWYPHDIPVMVGIPSKPAVSRRSNAAFVGQFSGSSPSCKLVTPHQTTRNPYITWVNDSKVRW